MRNIEIIRISEFEQMLKAHRFALTVDNPRELREVLEEEGRLQQVAINGDARFVNMFYNYQHRALEYVSNHSRHNDSGDDVRNDDVPDNGNYVDTGINFTEFHSRVRNFDWGYNTVQDRDRYNNGKKELEEIRHIAMDRGGEFIRFWEDECQKRKLWAFTRSQKSEISTRYH